MADSIADIRGQKIKELVEEMKLYNNPKELEEIRRVMRKNVPLSMRGYLMAYLYMTRYEAQGHSSNQHGNRNSRKQDEKRSSANSTIKTPIENTVSFYINVGKASKSSPKELAEFICEKASINSSDIVSIAYKPNYSFIYINKDVAEGIIDAVNGQPYKGRKVKINYSKD